MDNNATVKPILVVSCDSQFIELTKKVFNGSIDALYASNELEATKMLEVEKLSAILLGYIEPQESTFLLHNMISEKILSTEIPFLLASIDSEKQIERSSNIFVDSNNYIRISGDDLAALSDLLEPDSLAAIIRSNQGKRAKHFKDAVMRKDSFCVTWEQIAGKGAAEEQQEELINNSIRVMRGTEVDAVSVTDNPGGNPALSTEMICAEIKKMGVEPLVHLASRDKNRNQMESLLYGLSVAGLDNVLILSGDAPSNQGFHGKSKPVFDLDPVQTLQLIEEMNNGLEYYVGKTRKTLKPTNFFAGVCVSPFKQTEAELMGQYYKLQKKIKAGARYIINQVGFDVRKWDELLRWLKVKNYNIPVIANVYVMNYGTARLMNQNQIPGCVVTDKMLAELAEAAKSEDKGKSYNLVRAAKMYAIAKGMGFAGVHIGGHNLDYKSVQFIIEEGVKYSNNWQDLIKEFDYPQQDGYYYFEKDPTTGLNLDTPAARSKSVAPPLSYRVTRIIHTLLFNAGSRQFRMFQPAAAFLDRSKWRKHTFGYLEHLVKTALFGCMNCGDCALVDVAYICPMSQCPKSQRNGPCGGSSGGWCEVYPGVRKCVWVRAYDRLKAYKEEDSMGETLVPPCNWDLWETPSWLNLYLGRDHTAKANGVTPPARKSK